MWTLSTCVQNVKAKIFGSKVIAGGLEGDDGGNGTIVGNGFIVLVESDEDSLSQCLTRIPKKATQGQHLLATWTCANTVVIGNG